MIAFVHWVYALGIVGAFVVWMEKRHKEMQYSEKLSLKAFLSSAFTFSAAFAILLGGMWGLQRFFEVLALSSSLDFRGDVILGLLGSCFFKRIFRWGWGRSMVLLLSYFLGTHLLLSVSFVKALGLGIGTGLAFGFLSGLFLNFQERLALEPVPRRIQGAPQVFLVWVLVCVLTWAIFVSFMRGMG